MYTVNAGTKDEMEKQLNEYVLRLTLPATPPTEAWVQSYPTPEEYKEIHNQTGETTKETTKTSKTGDTSKTSETTKTTPKTSGKKKKT